MSFSTWDFHPEEKNLTKIKTRKGKPDKFPLEYGTDLAGTETTIQTNY